MAATAAAAKAAASTEGAFGKFANTSKRKEFFSNLIFKQRIICHFDTLCLKPTDLETVTTTVTSKDIGIVSFLVPSKNLQELVHQRYEVEDLAYDQSTGTPYGLLTCITSQFSVTDKKMKQGWFNRFFESEWIGQMILKTSVIDRHTWNRTAWHFRSYLKSPQWQNFPQKMYGIDLRSAKVNLDTKFNEEKNVFDRYYSEVPDIDFRMELEDTGVSVLDPEAKCVNGFVDNESALRVIAMHRESLMRGNEGTCFRTGVFSTPVIPNIATVKDFSIGRKVCDLFDLSEDQFPTEAPLCAWVVKDLPKTLVYQCESMVEDENEEHNWTDQNEKTYNDRAQKKTMNRNEAMQEEVRQKAYKEIALQQNINRFWAK